MITKTLHKIPKALDSSTSTTFKFKLNKNYKVVSTTNIDSAAKVSIEIIFQEYVLLLLW